MDRIKRASRWVSVLLVALVTMEVCARIDDWYVYDAPLLGDYSIDNLYYRDELGRWGKPNARFEKWRLNDVGLRGADFSPDSFRIAIVGSSETFGLYESEDREYPRLLEQQLRKACRGRVDVASVAFPGLHPQTVLRRLDWIERNVHPVVAVVYLPPANYAEVEVIAEEAFVPDGSRQAAFRQRFLEALPQFRIVGRGRALLKRHVPTEFVHLYHEWRIRQAVAGSSASDDVPEKRLTRMREDLVTLVRRLQSREVTVVLVTHASRFGQTLTADDRYWLTGWRIFYPSISEEGILRLERRGNELIRSVAQSEGVRLIDAAAKLDGRSEYFADFTHFTDVGAAAMAEALAPGLAKALPRSARCR